MPSTPPLTSDTCVPSSSQDLVSSSGPHTPHEWRNTVRFLHCAFDSDEDDDDDDDDSYGVEVSKLRGGQTISLRVPLTPTRSSRVNRATQTSEKAQFSPSRFVVKGTVTPSRAAPLFARFATGNVQRKRMRSNGDVGRERYEEMDWADENVEDSFSTSSSSPTKSPSLRQSLFEVAHQQRSTSFIPNPHDALPPLMPLPISLARRSHVIHSNCSSMVHALRSNNLAHLSFASSSRGTSAYAIAGRGVLSVARCLGAGMAGTHRGLSQRSFYQSFCTTSTPSKDLFTLQSGQDEQRFSHPLCAEYAHSARCLSGSRSQWLALGSNEGRISLLDTSGQSATCTSAADTPGWQAHDGSVFEVKWRSDDEQIASGGSDYSIRVWDTSSGRELRTFNGHRGTPRTVAWDPDGRGYLLASGGRDGGIHVYDTRTTVGGTGDPVASVWAAHASANETNGRRRRKGKADAAGGVRGITSLAYVPGRAAHTLCSAGCGGGTLKLWDLRNVAGAPSQNVDPTSSTAASTIDCLERSLDVSTHQRSQNKSSHGVSSIVATASKIFAACTDGCIYTLSTASLYDSPPSTSLGTPTVPLFDAVQRGNTLYARMSLHDDERTLALGCNSGLVTIWDTYAASSAASELAALGEDMTKVRVEGERLTGHAEGHEHLLEYAKPAILRGGHRNNFEINAVSWAHTEQGPTLASVSDDFTVRLWHSSNNL